MLGRSTKGRSAAWSLSPVRGWCAAFGKAAREILCAFSGHIPPGQVRRSPSGAGFPEWSTFGGRWGTGAFPPKISLTGACLHQQQKQAAAHGLPRTGQDFETGLAQAFLQALFVEAQPAVAVAAAHGLVVVLEEIGHEQVPARGQAAADLAQALAGVGQVVQDKVDAGEVRFLVTQGQVVQLADAQG